jgi:hypothetical protein
LGGAAPVGELVAPRAARWLASWEIPTGRKEWHGLTTPTNQAQ